LCKDPNFSIDFKYTTGDAWLFPSLQEWPHLPLEEPHRAAEVCLLRNEVGWRSSKMTCWGCVIPPRAGAPYPGIQHRAREAWLKPEQKT